MTGPGSAIRTLDHVGVGVRDLDVAQQAYERLGFRLTRRALLLIPGAAVGTWQPSGASNHCAVFQEGYVELVAITDPGRDNKFAVEIERYEGLHIIALGTPSADQVWRELAGRGIDASRPEVWGREVFRSGPPEVARFKFLVVPRAVAPEGIVIAVEHLTPALIRSPELLRHPNGALGLAEVTICAEHVDEAAGRYRCILGVDSVTVGAGRALSFSAGRVLILSRSEWDALYPGVPIPGLSSLVGLTVTVADLEATRRYLTAQGIRVEHTPEAGAWIRPDVALGVAIRFVQA